MPASDWNVVVTAASEPQAFETVLGCIRELGIVSRTDYWNVLVMHVDDPLRLLRDVEGLTELNPAFGKALSRVMPVTQGFGFQSAEEFEARSCDVARQWLPLLREQRFHVRMHRRGFKYRLSSQHEERFLDHFIIGALHAEGSSAEITFDDPDYILAVETVGQRAGMSLWSRDDLRRHARLLKLD